MMSSAFHNSMQSTRTVIAMVGLPARGKSYITSKLTGFLNKRGLKTKAFNLGQYRRLVTTETSHDFFRPDNKEAQIIREKCAMLAIEDASMFLDTDGQVAVIDATNTTRQRRKMLLHHFTEKRHFQVFFVESICEDPAIIEANILEAKVLGPDYKGEVEKETVIKDFMQRIQHYRQVYESMDLEHEVDVSFIQIIDKGRQYVVNRPRGLLQSQVLIYLMSLYNPGVDVSHEDNGEE